jgi:hypothetical protein
MGVQLAGRKQRPYLAYPRRTGIVMDLLIKEWAYCGILPCRDQNNNIDKSGV